METAVKQPGQRPRRARRWLAWTSLLAVAAGLCGCRTLGFYAQALKGQYEIVAHEQRISKLLNDPNTPATLRQRFLVLAELRDFARTNLHLKVDGHYEKYVDLHRPYVVWNVEAAPEFSMQPKTWWYPVVGSLDYRGYFSRSSATNYAGWLRARGWDVSVGGVSAYSTLGWFKDPVLNTFIFDPDAELAELIFHELAHARVFAHGDTDFNEAFATTVGEEGARRWLEARGDSAALERYATHLDRTRQFVELTLKARARLEALYGDTRDAKGRIRAARTRESMPPETLRVQKRQVLDELRNEFAQLRQRWGGGAQYENWYGGEINNAHLNSVATYHEFVPAFERLLDANRGDLVKFYEAAKALASQSRAERHRWLLAQGSPTEPRSP